MEEFTHDHLITVVEADIAVIGARDRGIIETHWQTVFYEAQACALAERMIAAGYDVSIMELG